MKRRQLLIVAGLLIVVIVVVWYLALWSPRQHAIKKATADAATAQANVATLQGQLSALQAQAATQTQRQIELTRLRAAIPATPDISSVIVSLYNAASDAGIDLTSLSDSPPATGSPPAVKINMAVTGNFYEILQFMGDLAALPRIVVVDNVSMSPGGGATGAPQVGASPNLSVTLAGRVFVTSLSTSAATAPATAPTTSPPTSTTVPAGGSSPATTQPTSKTSAPSTTTTKPGIAPQ